MPVALVYLTEKLQQITSACIFSFFSSIYCFVFINTDLHSLCCCSATKLVNVFTFLYLFYCFRSSTKFLLHSLHSSELLLESISQNQFINTFITNGWVLNYNFHFLYSSISFLSYQLILWKKKKIHQMELLRVSLLPIGSSCNEVVLTYTSCMSTAFQTSVWESR